MIKLSERLKRQCPRSFETWLLNQQGRMCTVGDLADAIAFDMFHNYDAPKGRGIKAYRRHLDKCYAPEELKKALEDAWAEYRDFLYVMAKRRKRPARDHQQEGQ